MRKLILLILFLSFGVTNLFGQHLKKDGTPDRRYKENHLNTSVAPAAATYSGAHLKKDGTPDRRYKKNQSGAVRERDSKGRYVRSSSAKRKFMKESGFPKGRPGYVIDHIKPLKEGGCDCPANMQWQTIAEGKAKDKWE